MSHCRNALVFEIALFTHSMGSALSHLDSAILSLVPLPLIGHLIDHRNSGYKQLIRVIPHATD